MSAENINHTKQDHSGLRYWMERVLEEAERAAVSLETDPVHDLRVALRRCRSMADGLMAIDPDKTWKNMRKESRRLFKRLGELRDIQVLSQWTLQLGGPDDPVTNAMLAYLTQREQELKEEAAESLRLFDRDKWRDWIGRLHARTRRLPLGGTVFQVSAVRAWNEARALHRQAVRNRSNLSYHRLRIALKKFRYTVENFLPHLHAEWGGDLKNLQDWLGDLHDLSVLWETAVQIRAFPDADSRGRWHSLIHQERVSRIEQYRSKMLGSNSLWHVWRAGLPAPGRLRVSSLQMIEKCASLHGINLRHAQSVRRLALQLFDGLHSKGPSARDATKNQRAILHAAATLYEFGHEQDKRNGERTITRLLQQLSPLPGLTSESLELAAMVVGCQRSKSHGTDNPGVANLTTDRQQTVLELVGILRLARVLARDRERPVRNLKAQRLRDSIVILAEGYSELGPLAEKAARARYTLEYACQVPVLIRGISQQHEVSELSPVSA